MKITLEQSLLLRTLHQIGGVTLKRIQNNKKKYPGFAAFSTATLYRHAKKPIDGNTIVDRRTLNKGRPRKLTAHDQRALKRSIAALRIELGTFSSVDIQNSCNIKNFLSDIFFNNLHLCYYLLKCNGQV